MDEDEQSVVDADDEGSSLDIEDVDSSARYNSSVESHDKYDTVHCNNNANKESGGDILN